MLLSTGWCGWMWNHCWRIWNFQHANICVPEKWCQSRLILRSECWKAREISSPTRGSINTNHLAVFSIPFKFYHICFPSFCVRITKIFELILCCTYVNSYIKKHSKSLLLHSKIYWNSLKKIVHSAFRKESFVSINNNNNQNEFELSFFDRNLGDQSVLYMGIKS